MEQKWVPKRCTIFGQIGLQNWPLKWFLSNVPPGKKKHHFGYQCSLFFLPKCKWMWEKNEAQLQPSKSCQEKIGESSVHANTLIPQGKRPHSSQRANKLQLETAESSIHVMDCFLYIGRTAVSRAKNSLRKSARIKNSCASAKIRTETHLLAVLTEPARRNARSD